MKLEFEKFYKTRDGRKVGPMRSNNWTYYPFSGEYDGINDAWSVNGKWDNSLPNHPRDLIAEWVDETVVASASALVVPEEGKLMLECVPNGGWLISEHSGVKYEPRVIGAYTTAAEMIAALSAALGVTK